MDQVIIFNKSLHQRLQEYEEVLSLNETGHPIKKQWSNYLEFHIDPNGWQAIWKIPRLTCEDLKIPFPTIVLVYVENIDFTRLTANIKIIAVQDDISIPEYHIIPLTQIWPTKDQDKTVVLSLSITSNSLDMYRFFYTNIFMPWDYDEEEHNWLDSHLESRLRLFYDTKNGVIPKHMAEHIRSLVSEARKLQAKREKIELDLVDSDIEEDSNDDRVQSLMEINVKIIEIKGEFELLENPVTRNVIIKRQKSPNITTGKPQFWLVYNEGKIKEYISFFKRVEELHPIETFKTVPNLAMVLEYIAAQDTVILNKTRHTLDSVVVLESGCNLKGVYDKDATILSSTNSEIMLDFVGENIQLENLTINAAFSQCGILVRAGKTTLKNCRLIGDNKSSIQQGIIVLTGAELELLDCEITGFCTAIVGNSKAKINIRGSKVYDVNVGIKVHDFCLLKAENCSFHDCKEYGLCLETTEAPEGKSKVGNFAVLEIVSNIFIKDLNGKNNIKGDVLINQKPKIAAIQDLFSNPKLDPTRKTLSAAMDSSEEDMETNELNNTVIENMRGDGCKITTKD